MQAGGVAALAGLVLLVSLFVVYNEQRDTRARAFPDLANRAFIVKVNRLFRF